MEPEIQPLSNPVHPPEYSSGPQPDPAPDQGTQPNRDLHWCFVGPQGLRAGWSVVLSVFLFFAFRTLIGSIFLAVGLVDDNSGQTAASTFLLELIPLFSAIGAAAIVAGAEHRRILDFNLTGPGRPVRFLSGVGAGFLTLTALIATLHAGGWMRFGPVSLSGLQIFRYAALWGLAFLAVACVEEGLFRCYLQFTLTRGINFWWAAAAETGFCLYLALTPGHHGSRGVYAIALGGFIPCLTLHQRRTPRSGFWQAAWVSSTLFGLIHTSNFGENWIGIFAAAAIGFIFCVSIYVTGSAWWCIGCHAAWDWTETYFYGVADSGLPARGHLFTANPAGNPLLSGGADGPEGSLLVLGALVLLLALLLAVHYRRKPAAQLKAVAAD
jgi:membrane protease YdiL (CAAX protease family)